MSATPPEAPALRALQEDFRRYIVGGDDAIAERVTDSPRESREVLLAVYRDAYVLRLCEALTTDYPALWAVAGDDGFHRLCRDYVARHPSHHPSIRWYGRRMARFLREAEPWKAHPVLAEVAAWEWALGEAFDEADAAPIGFDAVVAMTPPEAWPVLRFETVPALRRLDLTWNAPQIWRADRDGEPVPAPEALETPLPWLIWRPDALETQFRSLEDDEAVALDALIDGCDFSAICEAIAPWHPADAAPGRAAGLLRAWIDGGVIADVILPDPDGAPD